MGVTAIDGPQSPDADRSQKIRVACRFVAPTDD